MNKILEALKPLLPADALKEVEAAIEQSFKEARVALDAEYNKNLQEAYADLSEQLVSAEKVAEKGYQEAYGIITDLRNRMEKMREEYDAQQEEGYEEAFQVIQAQETKYNTLEKKLYDEYDAKLMEMKVYVVDKFDQFVKYKGREIYENARRDILTDPRYAEHKVVLDKIVDAVAGHLDTENHVLASGTRMEEAYKRIKELEGQVRLIESRNIRLDVENRDLNEEVKKVKGRVLTESKTNEKKERLKNAQNATGRGRIVTEEQVEVIKEHNSDAPGKTNYDTNKLQLENANDLKVLAGVVKTR